MTDVGEDLADGKGPSDHASVASPLPEPIREVGRVDRAVYAAVALTPTPALDGPMRRLSDAASYSRLWMAIAAGMAVAGGFRGRRAAAIGLSAIGVTSAIVNQGIKRIYPRRRPERDELQIPGARLVKMPHSTSFPSGHSASAFAFAVAVGNELPLLGVALRFLAGAVAYSRVHTGVHYPADAIVGSIVGAGIGSMVADVARRRSDGAAFTAN